MAEHEDDLEVSRRYRELGREEPSSELDASILTEARRAAAAHPAPLVPPTGRRRWYFPVAAAAVIVLALAVTAQLEREQRPDAEGLPSSASAGPETSKETQTAPAAPPTQAPRKPAAKPAEPQAPAPAADMAEKRADRHEAAGAPAQPRNLATMESPEQALERIAKLRDEGRDDEADQALKEFRRRYPGFSVPPEMLRRVERR